jgi:hypothetical protein
MSTLRDGKVHGMERFLKGHGQQFRVGHDPDIVDIQVHRRLWAEFAALLSVFFSPD